VVGSREGEGPGKEVRTLKQYQIQFSTRLTVEMVAWLDDYCRETKKTKVEVVQEALEDYRKKVEKN